MVAIIKRILKEKPIMLKTSWKEPNNSEKTLERNPIILKNSWKEPNSSEISWKEPNSSEKTLEITPIILKNSWKEPNNSEKLMKGTQQFWKPLERNPIILKSLERNPIIMHVCMLHFVRPQRSLLVLHHLCVLFATETVDTCCQLLWETSRVFYPIVGFTLVLICLFF